MAHREITYAHRYHELLHLRNRLLPLDLRNHQTQPIKGHHVHIFCYHHHPLSPYDQLPKLLLPQKEQGDTKKYVQR